MIMVAHICGFADALPADVEFLRRYDLWNFMDYFDLVDID